MGSLQYVSLQYESFENGFITVRINNNKHTSQQQ